MKKIVISLIAVISLLPWGQTTAQNKVPVEIGINAGVGLSTLSYGLNNGKRDNKLGGKVGVTGTYFFTKNFGILSGIEIGCYNGSAKFDDLTVAYKTRFDASSPGGDDIEYRARMSNYTEKQNLLTINIPLMAQLQTEISEKAQVYMQAGVKVAIPVRGRYTSNGTEYSTSAFFFDENGEVEGGGSLIDGGLGTFDGAERKGRLVQKTSFMIAAEVGMKWSISSNCFLYTGIFADYGLTSAVGTKQNVSVVEYDPSGDAPIFGANSILSSHYRTSNATNYVTNKVVPFAVGLKFSFAFSMK